MRNQSVTQRSDEAFYALADPTRRAVLDRLRAGSQPAGRIAMAFPVSRPAISRHLRVLLEADLVQERRSGRHRVYQLNPAPLKAVDLWLANYRAFWGTKLAHLKAFAEARHAPRRGSGRPERQSKDGSTESRSSSSQSGESRSNHGITRQSRPRTRTTRRKDG